MILEQFVSPSLLLRKSGMARESPGAGTSRNRHDGREGLVPELVLSLMVKPFFCPCNISRVTTHKKLSQLI